MNIANILAGLEKLVVELLLWILFIPKTLYKIVSDPDWVPGYVDAELDRDPDRQSDSFDSYLSPILLFFTCSVVLFVILAENDEGLKPNVLLDALQGNTGILAALGFLSLPLLFSLGMETVRREVLTRQRIQRSMYIQCFYFSPLILSFLGLGLFLEMESLLGAAFMLAVVILLWFFIVEVRLIGRDLQIGTLRATAVFLGCSFTVLVVGIFVLFLSADPTVEMDAEEEGEPEEIVAQLQDSGVFSIVVEGFEGSFGNYTLAFTRNGKPAACLPALRTVSEGQPTICTFAGKSEDQIKITVSPVDEEFDVMLDVRFEGESIVGNEYAANALGVLGTLYVLVIGFAVLRGFVALVTSPAKDTKPGGS
jgi:hypothetical protein